MMSITQSSYAVLSGTAVQGLMDLSQLAVTKAGDDQLDDALERWGDETGETFLHLLGLCLQIDEPRRFSDLVSHLRDMDAAELRLTLLGMTAWSWRTVVGADTIAKAAEGDPKSVGILLSNDRYYAGVAAQALSHILPLSAAATQQALLRVLDAYTQSVDVERHASALESAAESVRALAAQSGWDDTIENLTGFRYYPEPEARQVVLMPHVADEGLALVQHDETRIIVYGTGGLKEVEAHAIEIGRALSDASRIELIATLKKGPRELGDLVEATGLTRSTVHHHLRVLRDARIISVAGNARSYRYELSDPGRLQAIAAVRSVLSVDSEGREDE